MEEEERRFAMDPARVAVIRSWDPEAARVETDLDLTDVAVVLRFRGVRAGGRGEARRGAGEASLDEEVPLSFPSVSGSLFATLLVGAAVISPVLLPLLFWAASSFRVFSLRGGGGIIARRCLGPPTE